MNIYLTTSSLADLYRTGVRNDMGLRRWSRLGGRGGKSTHVVLGVTAMGMLLVSLSRRVTR